MEKLECSYCNKKENKNRLLHIDIYREYKKDVVVLGNFYLCSNCENKLKDIIKNSKNK
ncbi:hypothetical protein R4J17_15055 [Brachyspira intermedia]|uniref:hypothetical protein n=1 Tax=Brachyspira TaxID=29521 RepID=UPI003004CC32